MTRQKKGLKDAPEIDGDDENAAEYDARHQLESGGERLVSLSKDEPDDLLDEADPVPPEGS